MLIVKIIGGLGNQMFQYAYAKALEQKGYEVRIDISAFDTYKLHGGYQLNKYNIDLQISSQDENKIFFQNNLIFKVLRKIGIKNSLTIKEQSLLFNQNLLAVENNKYIEGYFQSEYYFKNIREILLKQFVLKEEKTNFTKEIEKQILNSKNSCSLHIRRGDFVNSQNINIHGSCSLSYYKKAIEYLENEVHILNFFIFSDDIQWVKENLKIEKAIYIGNNENRVPHEDIYLMSLCTHNVIANSSFSWWSAWLNRNDDKIVVAPKRWFADEEMEAQSQDIVCNTWIKM